MLRFPQLHSGIIKVDGPWGVMMSLLRRFVEHFPVTNGSGGALAFGDVLYVSGNREVSQAIATSSAAADYVGVAAEPAAAGAQVVMATGNIARVRMESGLIPAANEQVFVSASDSGAATNVQPVGGGEYVMQIGWIWDASMYDDGVYMYCDVLLNRCCEPIAVG